MLNKDAEAAATFYAMLQMKKIDVSAIDAARKGGKPPA